MKQRSLCVRLRRGLLAAILCAVVICAGLGVSSCDTLIRAFTEQAGRNAANALTGR